MNCMVLEIQSRIVSYSQEIEPVDLLDFLRAAPKGMQRIYWENRQLDLTFAGFGAAAELSASGRDRFDAIRAEIEQLFAEIATNTHSLAKPRLFGGFSFQSSYAPHGIWSAFPSAYFILPRYQFTKFQGKTWLTINSTEHEFGQIEDELDVLIEKLSQPASQPPHTLKDSQISYPLTAEQWNEEITDATRRMKAGELDKVVLSRSSDVTFSRAIDPLDALQRLQQRYPDTYRFLIEPQANSAFFGATPELLIEKHGHQIRTAALAGSIKRGTTSNEDDQLAAQLFQSLKDRHEHHLVVLALEDLLLPITAKLNVPEAPHILKLSNIQHLYSPITGELNNDYHVLDVVEKLHPTPALGGYPRNVAMDTIATAETISRGWYAAPVGWIDAEGNGTFAVAIRSAVTQGSQARLYAGAGIVADSDPAKEWDETRLKFRPMLDALGVES